ncbi:MAG TPA: adenylosuccinate lyase [Candidatus Saccharimonadales bacterium]
MTLAPLELPVDEIPDRFSAIDPLDGRYYDSEISRYLSERSRVAHQAYLEAALAQALAARGICSEDVANEIVEAARQVKIEDVERHEQTTKHDIKAVVNTIKDLISDEAKPFVHFGATSNDIISSATTLQLRTAITDLIIPRLDTLIHTLIELAERYADTTQIGRTHGQHGVPLTFGYYLSGYVSRLGQTRMALADLADGLRGKFSGAVGAYNALSVFVDDPLQFEHDVLASVDLKPAEFSSQIVPSEQFARLIDELAITANVMANLSHDMRHLQRTEIGEVREKFEKGQTGSSTMAHKRNPWNFENVISMSKQVTAQTINANMNIVSEHQRDLTDSSSGRFYTLPIAAVASMASRLNRIMAKIEVDEEAMQRNLKLTGGAIAAEPLYLLLERQGHTTAHEKIKELAHGALEQGITLAEAAKNDDEVRPYWEKFTAEERALIETPEVSYVGIAPDKARKICSNWREQLS